MFSWRKYLSTQRTAKVITILIFLGVLFAVGFAIYSFFRWEFGLIARDPYLRVALPLYFYEGLFLIVFGLVFVSSFIVGMFALFRGRDDALIMASPRYARVFWRSYARTFIQSLWPIAVIVAPAFLGSAAVFPVSAAGAVLFFLAIAFLTGMGVALAMMLFIVASCTLYLIERFYRRYFGLCGLFSFGKAAFLGTAAMGVAIAFGAHHAWSGDVLSLFAPTIGANPAFPGSGSRIDVILGRFSAFPSHLATLALFYAQAGAFGPAAVATLGLCLMCGICLWMLRLGAHAFLGLWQLFQEGRFEAAQKMPRQVRGMGLIPSGSFPRFWKTPLGALFEKEGIMLFRDGRSALWFFFLLALWTVQVAMGFFIRANLIKYQVNLSSVATQIETLELVTAVYFVSAFIVRFVFPAWSSERRTAWILGTAPVDRKSVFSAKLLFYTVTFLVLGALFCIVNLSLIQMPLSQAFTFGVTALLLIIFLVAFGLGLGALFPNFESDDPETLSTSLPGLGYTFGSLAYGGLGAYLFYRFLAGGPAEPLVLFGALTVALIILIVSLALRSLDRFEFIREYRA